MRKCFNIKDIIISAIFIIFTLLLLISKMPVSYVNLSIEYESELTDSNSVIYLDVGNGFTSEDSISDNNNGTIFNFYIDEKYYNINNFGIQANSEDVKIKRVLISSRNKVLIRLSEEDIYRDLNSNDNEIIKLSQEFVDKYNKACSDDYRLKLQIVILVAILYIIFILIKIIKCIYVKFGYKPTIALILTIIYTIIALYLVNNLSESVIQKSLNIPSTGITQVINNDEVYKQSFEGDKDILGVSLRFGTNMSSIDGTYLFSIYNENDDLVYSREIEGSSIEDNKYYDVNISECILEDNKNYYFTIKSLDNAQEDKLVLWIGEGDYYSKGELYEGSNDMNSDISFELIMKGPNRFLTVFIPFTIFYLILIASVFYKSLRINPKKLILTIYICAFIFSGFKMFFYLNYARVDQFDELAHISYVAYLEENNDIVIPKFSDVKILMKYTAQEQENPYDNVTSTGVYSGNYEGKFTEAINYLGHPPLYYHIMKLTNSVTINGDRVTVNLTRMRVCNIFIVLSCIFLMFYIGYTRISKKPYLHLLFALIINSVHMLLYEGASVNNDNLTLVGVTVFLLGAIRYCEKKYNIKTYIIVALGIVLTVLSKLSAGAIVVIAALILVIWNCISEKNIKFIFNKQFFVTLPIYLLGMSYFIYVFFTEGTFQPSLSTYGAEQFTNNSLVYVQPELRTQLTFWEFFKSFWSGFFAQWTAGVPSFPARRSIFTITRIGTLLFWVIPLGIFTKYIRKNGDNKIKVYLSMVIGTIVALVLQFNRGFKDFYFISGHVARQSRYYVCLTLMFALIIIFILETWMNKSENDFNIAYGNRNLILTKESIIKVICIVYSSLLFFEGFIQCIINNTNYLL